MLTGEETIRVLHVDDDPEFAEMAATFVEDVNDRIDVEIVTTPQAALDRLSAHDATGVTDVAVDCVVSDYDMPERNGIELLEAVREAFPDLPFILYTGKGSEAVASDAISAGVTDYLQKSRGTDQYEILAHRIVNAVTAYRSAAEAEQRRHRLEQILKTVPGCVVQLDADGRFVYANRRAKEVLGLEQSAVTERGYNDPEWKIRDLDGEPIPDAELPFRRVRDSGEPLYGYQHTIEWPDGTRKVLVVNGAPLFDADGDVERVVFSLVDVTERTERERSLRETERRLQLVLAATETGVWEWDLDTDEVWWSETLERVMGLDPGSFEGTLAAVLERVHPDDRAAVRERIDRAVETDETYETEFRLFHADGDVRWVAVRGQLVEDDDGLRMVGVHQDVTERRQLQSELAATAERYRTLVENVPLGGVFLYDESLNCVLAGGKAIADVGLSPEDIEGKSPSERYPEHLAEEIEAHLRVAFDGQHGTFEQTYLGRRYQIWTLPVERPDGTIDRVMAVSRDVTDRTRREQELEAERERFAEFASVVSHDLRSPLSVADGRVALAREECDSEHLDAVETALDRMDRIIEDVLWLARNAGDVRETESVDIEAQVTAAWELTADSYADAELVVTAAETACLGWEADASLLAQLLENLFRNALEHAGADVTVTVRLLEDGLAVEDDGPGIPESERERLFDAGYSTAEGGTGFGLHVVRRLAAAHGWDVTVGETQTGGARFEITGVEPAGDD